MTVNQKKFLQAFKKAAGNVSYACGAANISRTTFYRWKKDSKEFDLAVNEIEELIIDKAESQLLKAITDGNLTAIIFFLKTKGRKRGYSESVKILGDPDEPIVVKELRINKK